MTTIPVGTPGRAGGVDTENFKQFPLFLSNSPPVHSREVAVANTAAATTYALYSVVKLDADGRISGLADNLSGADADGARGIVAGRVVSNIAGTSFPTTHIYEGGHFSIDALTFDEATFDTDAKKIAAFRGAPTPAVVQLGINKYHRKT